MSDEAQTKPTLETILERINALGARMDKRFDTLDDRIARIEIRLDRIESMALETRADLREFKMQFKEPA